MAGTESAPKFKRRIYIVNPKMQLSIVLTTAGILALLGAFFAAAMYVIPDDGFFDLMDGKEIRSFLLRLTVAYFLFCVSSVFALTVILTHRVAGPVMVMEHAIRGMIEGDFTKRLSLREKDYLKSLAAHLSRLRDHMVDNRDRRLLIAQELESALETGETERAHDLVRELAATEASATARSSSEEQEEAEPEPELVQA